MIITKNKGDFKMNELEKVIEMLAEKLECEKDTLSAETEFTSLGIDSLDVMELLMNVEEEFDVEIEVGDSQINTIGDLVSIIADSKNA